MRPRSPALAPDTSTPDLSPRAQPNAQPMRAWRERLRKSNGAIVQVHLGDAATAALKAMAGSRQRGPLIERLIVEEFERRKRDKKQD